MKENLILAIYNVNNKAAMDPGLQMQDVKALLAGLSR